jgi:hypothetical protein
LDKHHTKSLPRKNARYSRKRDDIFTYNILEIIASGLLKSYSLGSVKIFLLRTMIQGLWGMVSIFSPFLKKS